jgi:hypothetical protein
MAISRFIVMATLQAARAHELGLERDSSYSWGLDRAIFYAAAKRGFKSGGGFSRGGSSEKSSGKEDENAFRLGDELAFEKKENGKTFFEIGGKVQTPEDFERQIVRRFGGEFDRAWEEAMKIVHSAGKDALLSQRRFYEEVYKPRRDALAKKWTEMSGTQPKKTSSVHSAKIKVKSA